ncbi:DUF4221 family protein [Algoriphagus sp. D3-2-R+10]|uniref:DUF4221 family protein n=1 Tax=Algoriphagus aurantiacus TaxID=3103948 RepID=UPI002B3735C3|nr:DUF4221 family protein [Algoriphagus sp. D3-2-R+10]MEB2776597.1 DUF4221 family protein [Algoriphagus sp. D3-2-R+10]
MKNQLTISILTLLAACGGKEPESTEQKNILENLTYTVDTVLVDPGEDFLIIANGLYPYSLTEDKTKLYFFERDPYKLVEVDLDNLVVLKKTEFEAEGPDGIGSYLSGLEIGRDGNIFLKSNNTIGIFDQNAKKSKDLKFVPSGIDSTLAKSYNALYSNSVYDFGTQKIYSRPSFADAGEYGLFILNPETQVARSLPIPKMKIIDDYTGTLIFKNEAGMEILSFYFVGSFITLLPSELIISTAAMSGFYHMDLQTEKMKFIDIQHQSVPNEMKIEIPKNPSDPEQVSEIQNKIFEHVNFQEMLWDNSRQTYFRFGVKTFDGKSQGDPTTYEIHLFAYDKDFNVLGETKMEKLKTVPSYAFFKDGKLWSYVNVEDELGFAVFTFDFN